MAWCTYNCGHWAYNAYNNQCCCNHFLPDFADDDGSAPPRATIPLPDASTDMNRPFRRDGGGDYFPNPGPARPLRLVASGTLFLTYHLALPSHPAPAAAVRAHAVRKSRGGSASSILAVAAQLPGVDAQLVAPLSGNEEGRAIARELERERVGTRFCKIWKAAGVPTAWVLHAGALVERGELWGRAKLID